MYYLADHLGSVRQTTDGDGAVVGMNAYRPFGEALETAGTVSSMFGYVGEALDETGLVYLRARYYAPGWGGFVSVDPWEGNIKQPLTLNAYLYAVGNPVRFVDPTGWQSCDYDPACDNVKQISGVWVKFVPEDDASCKIPEIMDFAYFKIPVNFLPYKWGLWERLQVAQSLSTVFDGYINLKTFGNAAAFMAATNISQSRPLKLVRLGPFPGTGSWIGAIYNGHYYFQDNYFIGGSDVRLWNGYHEIAHLWDAAQGFRLSQELETERLQHGNPMQSGLGKINPLDQTSKGFLINQGWYYATEYALDNWYNPKEDWAETVAWLFASMQERKVVGNAATTMTGSWAKREWVRNRIGYPRTQYKLNEDDSLPTR